MVFFAKQCAATAELGSRLRSRRHRDKSYSLILDDGRAGSCFQSCSLSPSILRLFTRELSSGRTTKEQPERRFVWARRNRPKKRKWLRKDPNLLAAKPHLHNLSCHVPTETLLLEKEANRGCESRTSATEHPSQVNAGCEITDRQRAR